MRPRASRLTRAGVELLPILMSLTAWGDRWCSPPGGAPVRFEHRGCGQLFTANVTCSACGEPVRASDVVPGPGPEIEAAPGTKLVPGQLRRLRAAGGASRDNS